MTDTTWAALTDEHRGREVQFAWPWDQQPATATLTAAAVRTGYTSGDPDPETGERPEVGATVHVLNLPDVGDQEVSLRDDLPVDVGDAPAGEPEPEPAPSEPAPEPEPTPDPAPAEPDSTPQEATT